MTKASFCYQHQYFSDMIPSPDDQNMYMLTLSFSLISTSVNIIYLVFKLLCVFCIYANAKALAGIGVSNKHERHIWHDTS